VAAPVKRGDNAAFEIAAELEQEATEIVRKPPGGGDLFDISVHVNVLRNAQQQLTVWLSDLPRAVRPIDAALCADLAWRIASSCDPQHSESLKQAAN
jgi:hypothetical protein